MSQKKVIRKKLKPSVNAKVYDLDPIEWEVQLEKSKRFNAFHFRHMHDGKRILSELNMYLRRQKAKSSVAYPIIKYLEFVASLSGVVSSVSLKQYRGTIEAAEKEVNTKASDFGHCLAFYKHLISSNIVTNELLPFNFKRNKPNPKESFFEAVNSDMLSLQAALEPYNSKIVAYSNRFNLSSEDTIACFYSDESMDVLHQYALSDLEKHLSDMTYVDKLRQGISEKETNELYKIVDFSEYYKIPIRTIEQAFAMLYAHYGNSLPSISSWVPGIYDVFKSGGLLSEDILKRFTELSVSKRDGVCDIQNLFSFEQLKEFQNIKDWRLKATKKNKSVEIGLKILLSKFGYNLPLPIEWPLGLSDYLKSNGWISSRVRSAFFPNHNIQGPLLVAILSHKELMPNVDSVLYYAYTDMISKSFENNNLRFFLGKERGKGVDVDISGNDRLAKLGQQYLEFYVSRLRTFPKGIRALEKENTSIFLHFYRYEGSNPNEQELVAYDRGMSANFVKRYIKRYSKKEPLLLPLVASEVTGENFRPTHTLVLKLKGVPQGKIKEKLAHSNSSTTKIYTDRVVTSSLLRRKHIKFQEFLVDQISNQKALVNEPQSYDDVELECNSEKRIVFKSLGIIAEWIAFRTKISKESDRLMLSNPARWKNHWEFKLAEYDVLISQVDSKEYHLAKEIAKGLELPHLD